MLPIVIAFAFSISVTLIVVLIGSWRQASAAEAAEVGERLSTFRSEAEERRRRAPLPNPQASFAHRVLRPMSRRLTNRIQRYLPAGMEDRIGASLEQAGMRIVASQFLLIVVVIGFVVPVLLAAMLFISGASPRMVMIIWCAMTFFGIYGARLWLSSKVKSRQKAIWKELPDAFDLVTASVEAGLGIDASLARVMEKTKGPFADELRNTMREISMGRSRRDALRALGERTGVPELQTFLNAIVQAETMGVSVGNVIRVQTGVLRTKRRQRAEEQAFKAPIKMVFPLVFFIFPSIFVIIGGPAVIALMDSF